VVRGNQKVAIYKLDTLHNKPANVKINNNTPY